MIGAIVLLAAVSLPFARAQNETIEEPTEFLYPQSCVSTDSFMVLQILIPFSSVQPLQLAL
jgi:hypothetical protein